jgi:hypothetical protein
MRKLFLIACGFLYISIVITQAYGNDWYGDIVRIQQKAQIRADKNQHLWDNTVKLTKCGKKLEKIPSQSGALSIESLKLGSEGRIDCWVGRIEHVLSPTNCIISYAQKRFFVLNDYNTVDLVDDMSVALIDNIKVMGTQTIKLIDGASKKVFVLEFIPLKMEIKNNKEKEKEEERLWIDNTGDFQVSAKFVDLNGQNVILERDGNKINIPLSRLSSKDQDYVRNEKQKRKTHLEDMSSQ